jgi:hypothetical protein
MICANIQGARRKEGFLPLQWIACINFIALYPPEHPDTKIRDLACRCCVTYVIALMIA